MIKLPRPNEVSFMSDEECDRWDPVKLACKFYELTGDDRVASILKKPWHPDPKIETGRWVCAPSYSTILDELAGISHKDVSLSEVRKAIYNLYFKELASAGWCVAKDNFDQSVYVYHPTTKPSGFFRRLFGSFKMLYD
jgi:hypothetical protein